MTRTNNITAKLKSPEAEAKAPSGQTHKHPYM